MPAAKPPEFRRRAVALARAGDQPIARIAADLGSPSRACAAGSSRTTWTPAVVATDCWVLQVSASGFYAGWNG